MDFFLQSVALMADVRRRRRADGSFGDVFYLGRWGVAAELPSWGTNEGGGPPGAAPCSSQWGPGAKGPRGGGRSGPFPGDSGLLPVPSESGYFVFPGSCKIPFNWLLGGRFAGLLALLIHCTKTPAAPVQLEATRLGDVRNSCHIPFWSHLKN